MRQAIGPLVSLRIDANRGWNFSQAVEFASLLGDANVEFIEVDLLTLTTAIGGK